MRGRRAAIAGLVAALLIPLVASAAEPDTRVYVSPTPAADWTVTIGGEGRIEPIFQGSKRDVLLPYPILAVRRFGTPEPFRGPRDGVGIGLFGDNVFQVGPVGQLRMPRRERFDAALQGLGDVPWAVELGVFAEYWMVPWLRTRVEVRQGFNGHHGLISDIFVDAVVPVGTQWTFSGGPRVTLATTAATSPYFGINAAQSAASRLPLFDAKGGVRSVGAGTQARYFWTPQFATHAFLEYERLTGDAAGSPLVEQRGTPNQLTIGFGATHSFDIKSPW
ncbi:MAG: MipA/OmpV family protein [Xanthobacteraceae bacterium]